MTKRAQQTETLFADPPEPAKTKIAAAAPKAKLPAKPASQARSKPGKALTVAKPQQQLAAPKTLPELIWMALKDPTVPADKLKEMVAMANEQEDRNTQKELRDAEKAFNAAMLKAQSEINPVVRRKFNQHTKSWWATLEEVSKIADPIIHANGFTLSYGMADCPKDDHYRITCDVSHSAGFTKRYFGDVGADSKGPKGEGTKSLAQGSGSSVTYGRRFLKQMIFDIKIVGQDTDGGGAEPAKITKKQAEELLTLCADKRVSKDQFSKAFGVDEIADLPAKRFDEAVGRISQKAA